MRVKDEVANHFLVHNVETASKSNVFGTILSLSLAQTVVFGGYTGSDQKSSGSLQFPSHSTSLVLECISLLVIDVG